MCHCLQQCPTLQPLPLLYLDRIDSASSLTRQNGASFFFSAFFFFACTPSSVWRYIKQDIFAINSVVATGLTQQTLHLGGCDTPLKCWADSSAKLSGCVWKLLELWNTAAKAFCVPSSVSPPFLPTANKLYWQTKAGLWWGDLQDNRIMEAKTSKHCDYVRGWAGWSCRRKGTTQKQ